ncbi:MAG TPA: hypothetical protein PLS58_09730 [Bacteroidales bacterium]|jgi:hypothetical protein|nr:hypothetical protein [Bacteroidales bacterium]
MIGKGFDREYLEWLQQLDADDGDSVWEAIENELDLIETWSRIDMELNRVLPQRKKIIPLEFLKVAGVAAAILLMISVPLLFVLNKGKISRTPVEQVISEATSPDSVPDNPAAPVQAEADRDIASPGATNNSDLLPYTAEIGPDPGEFQKNYLPGSYHEGVTPSRETSLMETPADTKSGDHPGKKDEPAISFITGIRADIVRPAVKGNVNTPGLIVPAIETTGATGISPARFIRILDAGLVYSYKNSWLLNYETWNCLNPTKLGNIMPTFRHDIGITSAVAFKEKHHFGLEFFWLSGAGQNYKQYIEASFVDRKIVLNYFKLQAFYLWNHQKIPGSTIFGGYYARLGMAEEIQGGQKFRVTDDYRDHDYGLVLGHQLNIPLVNSIVITPGIRINYNLMNIFEGHPGAVNIFKSTNNFSAGLNLAVSYSLKK